MAERMDVASAGRELQILQAATLCRQSFNRTDKTVCPISNILLHVFRLAKVSAISLLYPRQHTHAHFIPLDFSSLQITWSTAKNPGSQPARSISFTH